MKKVIVLLAVLAISANAFAAIDGSAHDFEAAAWNSTNADICGPCHAPHGVTSAAGRPLWVRSDNADAIYKMYGASATDGTGKTPLATASNIDIANDGKSKLCLSCHDGTVALDPTGTSSTVVTTGLVGTDLTTSHPISFGYSATATPGEAIHTTGNGYKAPPASLGLVEDGIVSCATCHDVHNSVAGTTALLRITQTGSLICTTCHSK